MHHLSYIQNVMNVANAKISQENCHVLRSVCGLVRVYTCPSHTTAW
jgi:hypothetical protein